MVVLQTLSGQKFVLSQGDNEIGREQGAAVPLSTSKVSRRHALLRWDGNEALLIDLGSSNGTFLNGNVLQPQQFYSLKVGDVIDIGGIDGRLFVNQIEPERPRPMVETPLPLTPASTSPAGAGAAMERAHLLRRVHELEEEVLLLKSTLRQPEDRSYPARFKQGVAFCQNHWTFLSFLGGMLVLLYINLAYGVDYFESYRNTGDTNRLSQFYTEMGDELLQRQEWQAAKEAYETAIAIKPSNVQAQYGVAQAETFDPVAEEQFYAPEVVDARLAYLSEKFPNDYRVDYLQGVRFYEKGEYANAIKAFETAIQRNASFVGGYVGLGTSYHQWGDLDQADSHYRRALTLDSNFSPAHNGLGFISIIRSNFDEAIGHLDQAFRLAPTVDTALGLGDAYRYGGDFTNALYYHETAWNILQIPDSEKERFAAGSYFYNLLPLDPGDQETAKTAIWFHAHAQKEMFAEYALSIDYALQGDTTRANQFWHRATNHLNDQLERDKPFYAEFFINQIDFTNRKVAQLSPEAKQWLREKRSELEPLMP